MDDLSISHAKKYIDGNGNLPEDRELDGNAGNLPRLILAWR